MDKKTNLTRILNEICSDENCKITGYCLLKDMLIQCDESPRFLIQLKCVEKFKYEESEREKREIDWNEAHMRWIDSGHATKFADLYNDEIGIKELYKKIIGK